MKELKNDEINNVIIKNIVRAVTSIMIVILIYSLFTSGQGTSLANGTESGIITNSGYPIESSPEPIRPINPIVKFSFDGNHANEIIIDNVDGENIRFEYTLDNGTNWKSISGLSCLLSEEELASINIHDGIKIKVIDTLNNQTYFDNINITKSNVPSGLYNNDFENTLYGTNNNMEWLMSDGNWTSFTTQPDLTGDKTIFVRTKAHGTSLPSESLMFQFTSDNYNSKHKYVPISHLGITEVSSQEGNNLASNVIDGNINTVWETSSSDAKKEITIGLTEPIYLSSMQYVPCRNEENGRIKNAIVYVSMDNITWTEAGRINNWSDDSSIKTYILNSSTPARYIRFKVVDSHGDGLTSTVAMLNFFEDTSKKVAPTARVKYDITNPTNGTVTASLYGASTEIWVTNVGGQRHTFIENGSFTFTFVDILGMEGSATATVDWIDKTAPLATVSYSTTSNTTGTVIATLENESEPIEIINNGGKNTYVFKRNGSFEFEYKDKAGNINKTLATVSWIKPKKVNPRPNTKPSSSNNNDKNNNENNNNDSPINNSDGSDNDENNEKPNDGNNNDIIDINEPTESDDIVNNISIELLNGTLEENLSLKIENLKLSKTLSAKVGNESLYFKAYYVDNEEKKANVEGPFKITIKLDVSKEFRGVYSVDDKDKITSLDYKKVDDTTLEVEVDELGQYVISYQKDESKKEKKSLVSDYILALICGILLAGMAIIIFKKTR